MNKDKKISLIRYITDLKERLAAPTPFKHKNHTESYRQFLTREIKAVEDRLYQAKLQETVQDKKL
jgi:hypothetical protein